MTIIKNQICTETMLKIFFMITAASHEYILNMIEDLVTDDRKVLFIVQAIVCMVQVLKI